MREWARSGWTADVSPGKSFDYLVLLGNANSIFPACCRGTDEPSCVMAQGEAEGEESE